MYNICVFAGTTEGRELVGFLSDQPCRVTACVATEYGQTLLDSGERLTVLAGRMTESEMAEFMRRECFDLVLDATHPYAQIVTENIHAACEKTETAYYRVLREDSAFLDGAVYVPDIPEAVEYLNGTSGSILLTTGSKELLKFAGLTGFADRVYARVLPMESSLAACREAGMKPARILAMQGPFTEEMNAAMLAYTGAKYLVTKDGGETGGFPEKAAAAQKAGVQMVVIGRPPQLAGKTLQETISELVDRFGFSIKPKVSVIGIGPGNKRFMTEAAREAIESARCVIGAKRMLEAVVAPGQIVVDAISPAKIAEAVYAQGAVGKVTVVMSGDTGFFSGTKKLLPLLENAEVTVLPGISSLSMLCARAGVSYEDVLTISLHGRQDSISRYVRNHRRVFALVGGENGAGELCRQLCDSDLAHVQVIVGQRLSYPDESIITGTAAELAEMNFASLSAVLIENPDPKKILSFSFPDNAFQRAGGKDGVVPMTKEEIRTISLSKLQLTDEAVCWDVGAGTGSVSVEMSLRCPGGQVYAVERKADAVQLLEENRKKFHADNLHVVSGLAPEACENLPAPTHVFVGGSAGNLRQILEVAWSRNPSARIVVTAIALETVSELTDLLEEHPNAEAVCVNVAKSHSAGPYHLMLGSNPVYIVTFPGGSTP